MREYSLKILPYVLSMSEKYKSTICVLHVIEDIAKWGGFYIPHIPLEMYQNAAVVSAEKFIDRFCKEEMRGGLEFESKILCGDPASEILKTIESKEIDLVIMGTHGRKGLEHVFFGSVAENVVKKSPVPVLTINPYKVK
jgi:nucleotide-binding universal stress UspA family protein